MPAASHRQVVDRQYGTGRRKTATARVYISREPEKSPSTSARSMSSSAARPAA